MRNNGEIFLYGLVGLEESESMALLLNMLHPPFPSDTVSCGFFIGSHVTSDYPYLGANTHTEFRIHYSSRVNAAVIDTFIRKQKQ